MISPGDEPSPNEGCPTILWVTTPAIFLACATAMTEAAFSGHNKSAVQEEIDAVERLPTLAADARRRLG
jgi:hypothetical protein